MTGVRRGGGMERDLLAQAGTMLHDLVGESLSKNERSAVENWLSAQLEAERTGWKQKLNMAMKEIEKERKLALEVHNAVHRMNENIENNYLTNLHREPTMYMGADKDMKVNHIVALEKHVNAMLTFIETAEEERAKFLTRFVAPQCAADVDSGEGSDLVDVVTLDDVTSKVEQLKQDVLQAHADAIDTEERLTKEIKVLTDTVNMQEGLISDMKNTHAQQVTQLQKAARESRSRKTVTVAPSGDAKTKQDKGINVDIKPIVRECCIQTDTNLDGDKSEPTPVVSSSNETRLLGRNVFHDTKEGSGSLFLTPITEVTFNTKEVTSISDQYSTSNSGASGSTLDMSRGDYVTDATHRSVKRPMEIDQSHSSDQVETLRNQVVSFAQKLEQARWKMSEYERQMSHMRAGPRCKRSTGAPTVHTKDTNATVALHRQWKSSEGYLCGVRKDIADSPRRDSEPANKEKKRSRHGFSNQGATNTCFRCHQLYRNKENHRMACRYHPKSKQNIERYDNTGKLLKIVQVWECCMQQNDAVGCTVGEHI